jgi:hypothetical protein|tara:strand:- start:6893 stop:7651 length:759 start_codon:yes stop_codon:yes gene_type:complete
MTQGYVIYAQGQTHIKYALNCAKSLKKIGDNKSISLITDKKHTSYLETFDNVIEVEKNYDHFHVINRSKLFEYSPYDETTVIESDCIVAQNLDNWWIRNKTKDLSFISQAYTYRQEPLDTTVDRKTFVENNLPNLYVAMHYFKKTDFTKQFFDLVHTINTTEELRKKLLPNRSPKIPSMDVAVCLAAKLLNCKDKIEYTGTDPMLIHMKPYAQGWQNPFQEWNKRINFFYGDELFVGPYRQQGIFHFIEDVI